MAKLFFTYASMNVGKSTQLLQVAYNYNERGQNVLLYKPAFDTRTKDTIGSRIGIQRECRCVHVHENMFTLVETESKLQKIDCVLVDEVQFLTEKQIWELSDIVDKLGIPVMCYGLRTDFLGNLFPGSRALLAIADETRQLPGICDCGRKTCMVARTDDNGNVIRRGEQICIGAEQRYVSFCRKCWKEKLSYNWDQFKQT
ncbi:thymidine kinase [Aeromonas phage phiAS5]|uniref:Thymidine kinase n=1 Tax=Aeromonas phage phiAS5 TaxID=879630 RepID=E1A245_9CAUD|nr:thymidine kinase [Aeromonas phage phiAS5]ADM80134.1 thymidine kinase [Aeromonas phage phiAS5]BES53104.1 thymidine kinase [Aeromonas phage phiWae14]